MTLVIGASTRNHSSVSPSEKQKRHLGWIFAAIWIIVSDTVIRILRSDTSGRLDILQKENGSFTTDGNE